MVNSKTAPPHPAQTPGHLTFVKNFGHIRRCVASLDGQMPDPLELQRGSNRLFKCTYSVINYHLDYQSTRTEKPWLFYHIHLLMKKTLIQRIIYANKDDRQKRKKL